MEARFTELAYGQLGKAEYDQERKKWVFGRQPGISRQIRSLGPRVILQAPLKNSRPNDGSTTEKYDGKTSILRNNPELFPATLSLPKWEVSASDEEDISEDHLREPEAAKGRRTNLDPTTSDLLAFGYVANSSTSNRRQLSKPSRFLRVAAFTCGPTGEVLKLTLLNKEHWRWENEKSLSLFAHTAYSGESGFWSGSRSPILQVTFAEGSDRSQSWLAVRSEASISIVRPEICRDSVFPIDSFKGHWSLPPSRVFARNVCTLSAQDATKASFSDITFNPWNCQQIAIIDQAGHWSVWDINTNKTSSNTLTKLYESQIWPKQLFGDELPESLDLQDGWAKILWVDSSQTILVAVRRYWKVFRLDDIALDLHAPDIGLTSSGDWILDVKRASKVRSIFFVLTSSRVLCIRVTSSGADQSSDQPFTTLSVLLTWTHFRDITDTTQTLSVFDSGDGDLDNNGNSLMVLHYSKINSLVTVFTYEILDGGNGATSICDPYILPVKESKSDALGRMTSEQLGAPEREILALQLAAVRIKSAPGFTEKPSWTHAEPRFYKLQVLDSDMLLSEELYVGWKAGFPLPCSTPTAVTRKGFSRTLSRIFDDFIAPDGVVADFETLFETKSDQQKVTERSLESMNADLDLKFFDMVWLADEISKSISSRRALERTSAERHQSPAVAFEKCIDQIRDAIAEKSRSSTPGIDLLYELQHLSPSITDVEYESILFSQLLDDLNLKTSFSQEEGRLESPLDSIAVTSLPHWILASLGLSESSDLEGVYEKLVAEFLSFLTQAIPNRTRVAVEAQIRDAVIHICLASYGVRFDEATVEPRPFFQDGATPPNLSHTIPLRRKASASKLTIASASNADQIVGPTIADEEKEIASSPLLSQDLGFQVQSQSTTAIQSSPWTTALSPYVSATSISALSQSSQGNERQFDEDVSSQRLRTLTHLTRQPRLPTKASNILSHWTIGTDPANYGWAAMQASLDVAERVIDETPATEISKKRSKKRKQVHRDGESQNDVAISSQRSAIPPSVSTSSYWPSQQSQSQLRSQSQSQFQSQSQSQILPFPETEPQSQPQPRSQSQILTQESSFSRPSTNTNTNMDTNIRPTQQEQDEGEGEEEAEAEGGRSSQPSLNKRRAQDPRKLTSASASTPVSTVRKEKAKEEGKEKGKGKEKEKGKQKQKRTRGF